MLKRRDALKLGAAAAGAGFASKYAFGAEGHGPAQHVIERQPGFFPQSGLVFPQTFRPSVVSRPSPKVTPFTAPLFRMPVAQPIPEADLQQPVYGGEPVDPERHQLFDEFQPQKFYVERLQEAKWSYHPEAPFANGSWHYTFTGRNFQNIAPGPTYKAKYGEPAFVRRINEHPDIGTGNVNFAVPSFSIHLHNAHTASESDGIPQDYFDPGEFWDHHYANFTAGDFTSQNDSERMSTLWYHDHRLDFTATNVYAGHSGFYLLFDDKDSDNERDPNPQAFRLPSGEYDIPLMIHDVQFALDDNGDAQVVWDFFSPDIQNIDGEYLPSFQHTTFGMLGDTMTVNRTIQPYLEVKRRKYRFRVLNGGPTRVYNFYLRSDSDDPRARKGEKFVILTNDGNFLQFPIESENVEIWVANRSDVIIDFSHFKPGDNVYLVNRLEMQEDGEGITGRTLDEGDGVMQFRVMADEVEDPSRIPDRLRRQPDIDFREVRRQRTWKFDYDSGLFTVNGRLMDPNRVDAAIEQGSAEIWTIRNSGNTWTHPIHTHMEEFQIFEINGKPVEPFSFRDGKKDVVQLGPNDEIKFFGRWRDFLGPYVMHCHNVVHEDHAMMIRWDLVEPGEGNCAEYPYDSCEPGERPFDPKAGE